jgi:hypothetical protein
MARLFFARCAIAALVCVLGGAACASRQQAPPSPTAETLKNIRGSWRLSSFSPQKPLEQPFQGLLEAQLKALVISFQGDQYFAAGPGVNLQGRFQVTNAVGDQFSMTLFDPDGVAYPVAGRFRGAELDFQSHNERWRGSGVLTRLPAPR